jgi:hypothetical protein
VETRSKAVVAAAQVRQAQGQMAVLVFNLLLMVLQPIMLEAVAAVALINQVDKMRSCQVLAV